MADSPLVSTEWLNARLGTPSLSIVDGSWWLPNAERNAEKEYLRAHIPGAVFFDIDAISDHATDLPHMLPKPEAFAKAVSELGIGSDHTVVIYDAAGLFSAARVWWTFKIMGAKEVYVLDGGLPKWRAENRPLEEGRNAPTHHAFTPVFNADAVASSAEVLRALEAKTQVVDARPAPRFRGEAAEPRPGLRAGHMPGGLNLPSNTLVGEDGRLKPPAEIEAAFKKSGVDLSKPIITSCGSGVTAAILMLGLESIGHKEKRLYDGSWAEWGAREDLPISTA